MFKKNMCINVSFYILCSKIILWNTATGEWIDLPQFSDDSKIYRVPSGRQNSFYKFSQSNTNNYSPYEPYNGIRNNMEKERILFNGTRNQNGIHVQSDILPDSTITINDYYNKEDITTEQYINTVSFSPKEDKLKDDKYCNQSQNVKNAKILEYLPVDIFKSVHHTLTSQPSSTEGKILFLKRFEKILMSEIESQLALTMTSSRDKRGADHYDHSYDDHDDHSVGFPSIEGALMAISFLTFAVYLVRLVMLLFRNMNNTTGTTTGGTVFLGRRKRSINEFDENVAKILSRMDNFIYNL